jgi:predicted phosphodiesterase
MGAVVFSDVHADAGAITALRSWIRKPAFVKHFGTIDVVINLGDILHRGDHPKEALEHVHALAHEFRLISVMGNHDHAFLNGLLVSGSDAASTYRHEQLRGSPLLSIFSGMPMEWVNEGILFVHGGPMELDSSTLHLKCWQRLGRDAGDSYTGYHYTPEMAFSAIRGRGLTHMCCGHQHNNLCCIKIPEGIKQYELVFRPIAEKGSELGALHVAEVPLDVPTILRVGACHGTNPEFAYTDFTTFSFIRIESPGLPQ